MGKNIIICCDGTGNEYGQNNTNVVGAYEAFVRDHCCPVKSRIESIGWGHRGIRFGSRMAGVPVKWAFFRIA